VVVAADVAVGSQHVLASALAIVALIVGVAGHRGDAAATAAVAIVAAALSGFWDEWGAPYTIALVVVVATSVIAMLLALVRVSASVSRRQVALLRRLLEFADGSDVDLIGDQLLDLLVPDLADSCALDLIVDGRDRRLGARVSGPGAGALETRLRNRAPSGGALPAGTRRAMQSGKSQLVEAVDDSFLQAMAHDEEDLDLLRGLDMRSAMFLPMTTRGMPFGAVTLAVGASGRRYTSDDLAFAELVASRMAIVLDNAGLWREAERTERQMVAALDSLEEAVTMNARDGRTVYANQAAVDLLGAESATELCSAAPGEISARFEIYDEAGKRLDSRSMPAFRALAGEEHPPATLVRTVMRATGHERWLLNKVSVLRDARGAVDRVVNVIEDVTDVKRAEVEQRLLGEATRVLADSLDYERTLEHVAEMTVPELADWCGVDLPGRGGNIDAVAVAHADPSRRTLGRRLREEYPVPMDSPTALAQVLREGGSALIESISDEDLVNFASDDEHLRLLRGVGFGSILIVAMSAGGQTLGALTSGALGPGPLLHRGRPAAGRRAGPAGWHRGAQRPSLHGAHAHHP
jgi:PAS domain S-box-containing protein